MTPSNPGNEQSKNASKLNSEVLGEDGRNSASNGNGEILKEKLSAPANDTNSMSLDQGIQLMSFGYFHGVLQHVLKHSNDFLSIRYGKIVNSNG